MKQLPFVLFISIKSIYGGLIPWSDAAVGLSVIN